MISDSDVESALQQERLDHHLKWLPGSLMGSAGFAGVIAAALWSPTRAIGLLGWLAALTLALALRFGTGWLQRRDAGAGTRALHWLRRHRAAYALHGLVWAILPWAAGAALQPHELDLLVFALGAITAGCMAITGFDLRAGLYFALPAAAVAVGLALDDGNGSSLTVAALSLLFLIFALQAAWRNQGLVRESVRLRLAEARRAEQARSSAERADATARRLEQQHRLLDQLLQTTEQGFWFTDSEGRTTDINPAMARLLGRPREEMLGRDALAELGPQARALLQQQLQQRGAGPTQALELSLQHPDGKRLLCLCSATSLRDEAGGGAGAVLVWTDLSERLRNEAALRRYEIAVNSITDMVSVVDTRRIYRLVNDAWCRATGVSREQAIGRATTQALPVAMSEARLRGLEDCISSGQPRTALGRPLASDAPDGVLETTYFPHRGADGKVSLVVMVTRDITEQEMRRVALEASEAEQRALLDNFPGYISRLDARATYSYVNPRLATLVGRSSDELVGRSLEDVLGPQRAAQLLPLVQRALDGQVQHYEHRIEPGEGRAAIDLQVSMVPGVDPRSGEAVVYGFSLDVSQRKQAEEALRASVAELGALLAAFPGYIAAVDERLVYTFANRGFLEVLGRRSEEVVGRHVREVLGKERAAQVADAVATALRGKRQVGESRYLLAGSGGELVLEVHHVAGPVQPDGRRTCYAFGIDLSARKAAEQALIAARNEAERANRAKSQFLSQMSHELRTPLNAILGFGQLLDSDPRGAPLPHQQPWLAEILRGAEHLLGLITEILDLGRIEAGELALDLQPLGLGEMLGDCLGLLGALAQGRGVRMLPLPAGLPAVWTLADRRRLKQVLLNLLGNAVKYNRSGGEVAVSWRSEGEQIWLGVHDQGRGLTAAEQQRLFQPFERLDAAQSGVEGTGIGLALSRRLVEAMGGSMGVQSTPGLGSTFWLRLPSADADAAPAEVAAPAPAGPVRREPAEAAPQRTVLYIEDNAVNVVLMEAMIARLPTVRLLCATTPTEGLRLAAADTPDLVLLDIHLPEMDGFAVLRRLRQMPALAATPVLAVSASAMPEDIAAALAAGFTAYLSKPLHLDALLDAVRLHLQAA